MKKALLKDSIKEIKLNYKRFISILLMAFLGVGFFAGMRASSPDMVDTINKYYKDNQVYDIEVISTLGLTNDDISQIEKMDFVENVIGTYETDGKLEIDNKEIITKVMCIEDLNRPSLIEGELPKNEDECVVEENFLISQNKKIGDTIDIEIENTKNDNGEEIPYLKQKSLKIVGRVKSPIYISRDRGTSTLGSGKINYYIYLTKENINASEIYTNLYITLKNAEDKKTSTDKYEDYVETAKNEIEKIKEEREKARYDKLIEIATQKIDDAEQQLNSEKQNAQNKIQDAEKQIETGKNEIIKSENQIANNEKKANTEFKNLNSQIQTAQKTIEENEKQLKAKEETANEQFKKLQEQEEELKKQLEIVDGVLNNSRDNNVEELQQSKLKLEAGIKQIEDTIRNGKQELENAKVQLETAKQELENNQKQYQTSRTNTYNKIASAKQKIEQSKKELQQGEEELEKNKQEFEKTIQEAETKLQDAREEINKIEYPKWYILDRYSNSGYNSFIQDTKSIENIANVFPVVFFVVAVLISLTSMTRMVEEQRMEIGTLKALGYNKFQIASKYIIYASLACIIGGILGMCVGFVLLPKIIWLMYQMMYQLPDINISFNMEMGAIGLVLISICIIGATIYAVLKELIHTPANLMRPKAPKMGKRVILEKIPFIWKHLSFTKKVTVRNIFRYKKRFLMTIIGILGCTSLLVVGFGLKDSILAIIPNQFEKVFNYDMQIGLKTELEENKMEELVNTLQDRNEIEEIVETYMTSNTAVNKDKEEDVQIIVPKQVDELEKVIQLSDYKTKEKVELKENEICLSDKTAQLLGVKVGDTITLEDSEENQREVKISAIIENYVYHYVYMSKETYENLYQQSFKTNVIWTKNINLTEEQEEKLASEIMNQQGVASISRISVMIDTMNDMMKSLNYVVAILIVSAGLLAFVVLYNLSNVNISERIRELATIKVLGFYDKEVYAYITRETVILTIIGMLLGLIGGYFLNNYIIETTEINMLRFSKIIHPISYVYAMLITIGFTVIVNIVTYFALKKIDMIENLKSVE